MNTLGNCFRMIVTCSDGKFPMILGYAATEALANHMVNGLKSSGFILPSDVITIEKAWIPTFTDRGE